MTGVQTCALPILVADVNAARAQLVARATGAMAVALRADTVQRALQGRRLRAAIDATGSIAALQALMACVSGGASVALVGISHDTLELDPNVLVERELTLIGCHAFQDELPEAIALLPACAAVIMLLIDREITLDEVPEVYARLAAGKSTGLKTLIRM